MLKKILCVLLCVLTVAVTGLSLAGCNQSGGNYPVTIGHTKISEKPEKVVVLSDNLADIIFYLGYSTQIAAISDTCTQNNLTRFIKSVGSELNPNVNDIITTEAKYVLTEKSLPDATVKALEEADIQIIEFLIPTTAEELKTTYLTLGKFLGGKKDGSAMGESQYTRNIQSLTQGADSVKSEVNVSFCYLYLDENGSLCSFPFNDQATENALVTQEGFTLSFMGATNVATNFQSLKVEKEILRVANPKYIFYDNDRVLDYLKRDSELKNLSALKNNNAFILNQSALQRQGVTMQETQSFMISKMFPNSQAAQVIGESLAERYGITLSEDIVLDPESDIENIKAMQQRLMDLGYLEIDDSTPTGYYGEQTTDAVKDFQSKNGLEATGIADYETLKILFDSTTLDINGAPFTPGTVDPGNMTEPTTEPTTNPTSQNYDITFDENTEFVLWNDYDEMPVIQQRLIDLGYMEPFTDGNTTTKTFGGTTQSAIIDFMAANGIEGDGTVIDYDILKALF